MSAPDSSVPASEERDIVRRIEGQSQRVHINLGPDCNNNCLFCMEEDREQRRQVNAALTPERIAEILEANAGASEVCFTSGEPTLVPHLARHAHRARQLDYGRISLMTNGRRLSHRPYLERLVAAGFDAFYISIHGHEARIHDGLVRTPGAFEQTLEGIRQVASIAGPRQLLLHTSTVVTSRNFRHFADIYRMLRTAGVHQVVFNVMQPNGRGHTHFEALFPRYTDIAAEFATFVEGCDEPRPNAFLVDIPLCTTEGVPDFNRGYVESYVHFEPGDEDSPVEREAARRAPPDGESGLQEVARADLDAVARIKRDECRGCRYDPVCEGVWRNYLARHGWDEMEPVPAAES